MLHKDSHKSHIEDHTLHQHPHEGDQEEVVEENSYDLAVDRDKNFACLVHSGHKYNLSYGQVEAEIHVNVVPHAVQ